MQRQAFLFVHDATDCSLECGVSDNHYVTAHAFRRPAKGLPIGKVGNELRITSHYWRSNANSKQVSCNYRQVARAWVKKWFEERNWHNNSSICQQFIKLNALFVPPSWNACKLIKLIESLHSRIESDCAGKRQVGDNQKMLSQRLPALFFNCKRLARCPMPSVYRTSWPTKYQFVYKPVSVECIRIALHFPKKKTFFFHF